jgi:hypothetical protein
VRQFNNTLSVVTSQNQFAVEKSRKHRETVFNCLDQNEEQLYQLPLVLLPAAFIAAGVGV